MCLASDDAGLNSKQIAEALGWQASSVRHVQVRYLQQGKRLCTTSPWWGPSCPPHSGGREESAGSLPRNSPKGEVVVAASVRRAYEERLGRPVHSSIVYRALHRQG